jgi:hypothetical protein
MQDISEIYPIHTNVNLTVADMRKRNSMIMTTMKEFNHAMKLADLQETAEKYDLVTKAVDTLTGSFSNMAQAASIAHRKSTSEWLRATSIIIGSTSDMISAVQTLQKVYQNVEKLGTASRMVSGLGAVGMIAGAVSSIAMIWQGRDRVGADSRRSKDFGATIQRGPQTININPVLSVTADHDVIFGEDGMAIVRDTLIANVQQAIDTGELSLDRL